MGAPYSKHNKVMDTDGDRQRQEDECLQESTPEGPNKGPWIAVSSAGAFGVSGYHYLGVHGSIKSQIRSPSIGHKLNHFLAVATAGAGCNPSSPSTRPHSR